MAGIEAIIDDLIKYVFNATVLDASDELFEPMKDEKDADFKNRSSASIKFMKEALLKNLELTRVEEAENTYRVTDILTQESIVFSNLHATATDILSSQFPDLIAEMKKIDASMSLYQAIEKIISEVEWSPLIPVLRKAVCAEKLNPRAWDRLIAHLVKNKDLCQENNKKRLVEEYKRFNQDWKESDLPMVSGNEQPVILPEKTDFQDLAKEFAGLMTILAEKVQDLAQRGENEGAIFAKDFYNELHNHWNTAATPFNLKEACENSIQKFEPNLNRSRGGEWKQWFADLGCWLLKVITCGCASIDDFKITTDTMRIALDIRKTVNTLAVCNENLFNNRVKTNRFFISDKSNITVENKRKIITDEEADLGPIITIK